jgi:hypothetical protein
MGPTAVIGGADQGVRDLEFLALDAVADPLIGAVLRHEVRLERVKKTACCSRSMRRSRWSRDIGQSGGVRLSSAFRIQVCDDAVGGWLGSGLK